MKCLHLRTDILFPKQTVNLKPDTSNPGVLCEVSEGFSSKMFKPSIDFAQFIFGEHITFLSPPVSNDDIVHDLNLLSTTTNSTSSICFGLGGFYL
jgi:hypothetical protein